MQPHVKEHQFLVSTEFGGKWPDSKNRLKKNVSDLR